MKKLLQIYANDSLIDELKVWQLFIEGNKHALSKIFISQYSYLFYYGISLTSDEDIVKDCIQDLFEKLWNKRENLVNISAVKPYLKVALRHQIIDEMVQVSKRVNSHSTCSNNFTFACSHEDTIITEQRETEQTKRLKKVMEILTKRQREAIQLRAYEELDYDKISELMSLNIQSVRNLIYKSVKIIRSHHNRIYSR